ncbi:VRR-NUC domain-containing protein [Idiomarina seosinensis]|uniref:VRR-NUC domain-containing protein n=1 Tax=Idiomarina seosinensis TaxID=281739 RepID=UPI00384B6726
MHWDIADVNDPLYYWKNFALVKSWVQEHHSELMNSALQSMINQYDLLSPDAQRLWLRLYSRKGEFFRIDRLNYPEIDVPLAISELTRQGWIQPADKSSQPHWLALLTKAELLALQPGALKALSKQQLLEQLSSTRVTSDIEIVQLLKNSQFNQLALLFFGNSRQQLSEFVVTALGHIQYESYLARPKTLFSGKDEMALFLQIEHWQTEYADLNTPQERIDWIRRWQQDTVLASFPERLTGKLSRFLNRLARDCERQHAVFLAHVLYRKSQRPPARERQARMYFKDRPLQARRLLFQMYQDPADETEFEVARQLLGRWFKCDFSQQSQTIASQSLTLGYTVRQVEKAVLAYYKSLGWHGSHSENIIPQTLFGLLFWDIIFYDIEGAFIHPFQRGPRDLRSPAFYQRRKALFQQRISMIRQQPGAAIALAARHAEQKKDIANPFVAWKINPVDEALTWFRQLPATLWADLFDRMAFDTKNNGSGFPDLWLYHPDQQQVQLIEVKGPGDTLRTNQSRWLQFFQTAEVPVTLLNVKPAVAES